MKDYDGGCCFRTLGKGSDIRVLWELTTKCNLRCNWCHTRTQESGFLPFDAIADGLKALKKANVKEIIFSGGEPLLRSDLFSILEEANYHGFKLDLCTNGTLIDQNMAHQLKRYLSEISISLDSYLPEKHDLIRGVSHSFEKTLRGIQYLQDEGIEIHIISMCCDDTCDDMHELLRLLESLKLHSVTLLGLIEIEGVKTPFHLSDVTRVKARTMIDQYRKQFVHMSINTKKIFTDDCQNMCPAGVTMLGIDAFGTLMPCILKKDGKKLLFDEWAHGENWILHKTEGRSDAAGN